MAEVEVSPPGLRTPLLPTSVLPFAASLALGCALWFTALQLFIIRQLCLYCTLTHAAASIASILILLNLPAPTPIAAGIGYTLLFITLQILIRPKQFQLTPAGDIPLVSIASAADLTPPQSAPTTLSESSSLVANRIQLSRADWPLLGSPTAPQTIAFLFDLTCTECRELYRTLLQATRQSPAFSVLAVPIPMHPACNPTVCKTTNPNPEACDFARLYLALWHTDPAIFRQCETWLLVGRSSLPSLMEARGHAGRLMGASRLSLALTNPTLDARMRLAAMVTALDRLDDLHDVRISLDFPGQVDGPSAGGVISLAIMSALDGRDWPKDCMMTGTIMPDGTIGEVGGIVQKLQAAATAGARRVLVPANLRFQKDLKTGMETDLKRLATSLKLELIPVENIAQAYAAAHNLPTVAPRPVPRDFLDLPAATEDWLKQAYKTDLETGSKIWDAIPKARQEELLAFPVANSYVVQSKIRAENAYRSGRFFSASHNMAAWRIALESIAKNESVLAGLKGGLGEHIGQLDDLVQQITKSLPDPWAQLQVSSKESPYVGAQLCGNYYERQWGPFVQLDHACTEIESNLGKLGEKNGGEQQNLFAQLYKEKGLQLLVLHMVQIRTVEAPANMKGLSATLPILTIKPEAAGVERLFYSAQLAAQNCLMKDVIKSAAIELKVTEEAMESELWQHDDTMATYLCTIAPVAELHAGLPTIKDPKIQRFALAAATQVHCTCLASASGLIARWSVLEPQIGDSGRMQYARTDLLNNLLNTARETARQNIAACKTRGFLCTQAISDFEEAEMRRDDMDEDKVDVLIVYWTASLEAKALMTLVEQDNAATKPR